MPQSGRQTLTLQLSTCRHSSPFCSFRMRVSILFSWSTPEPLSIIDITPNNNTVLIGCWDEWKLWRTWQLSITLKKRGPWKSQWHFLYCGEVISSKLYFILLLHFLFERQQFIAENDVCYNHRVSVLDRQKFDWQLREVRESRAVDAAKAFIFLENSTLMSLVHVDLELWDSDAIYAWSQQK